MSRMKRISPILVVLMLATFAASQAQNVTTPRPSPRAVTSQTVGLTEMEFVYHRPGVKERKIWGEVVPYGEKPMPWRAGANENTTFSTTHDLLVEGKRLPAGTYGIHMIPTETEWTIVFNGNHTSWGSFFYQKEEDVLRVKVTPVKSEHQEWLRYGFGDISPLGATAYLHWEKLKVPFRLEVADGHETVLAGFRNELRSLPGFFSQGYITAARYCVNNNINHEEAVQWADQAINRGGGFNAQMAKANLLAQSGKAAESEEITRVAIEGASENELNNYGYQLINQGKVKEAVKMFTLNVKRHPDSWNVYDSLGEGYDKDGDKATAAKYYRLALEKQPPENQIDRINTVLQRLESQ